jgi:SIR2-like domain
MTTMTLSELALRVREGSIVPYLGPGALSGVTDTSSGEAIPADSDSLILAMNNGTPMAPRLMFEFARAAMDMELKKGRNFVYRFLSETYGKRQWSRAPLHDWLSTGGARYIVDINRDTQLQDSFADTPHTLIRGISRIGGTDYRFRIHHYNGDSYREVAQEDVDAGLPILFKPMGSPVPDPTYIASDADYVDYITELMGGFAIPAFLKQHRKGKQYLLLGLRLNRDTERMVLSDIVYDGDTPTGWALIPEPTAKELRFCKKIGIEVIDADIGDLLAAAGAPAMRPEVDTSIGC